MPLGRWPHPRLTTISQDARLVSRAAARRLLAMLGEAIEEPRDPRRPSSSSANRRAPSDDSAGRDLSDAAQGPDQSASCRGGAVLSRMTSSVLSSTRFWERSSPRARVMAMVAAEAAMAASGW